MDAVLLGRRCSRHTAGRERRVAARADGARTAAGACARAVVGWHAGGGAALLTTGGVKRVRRKERVRLETPRDSILMKKCTVAKALSLRTRTPRG